MGCIQFLCGSNLATQALSCQGDNMELKFILFFKLATWKKKITKLDRSSWKPNEKARYLEK